MANSYDRLVALLQTLYAAPGTTEGWQRFLEQLTDAVKGGATGFVFYDPTAARGNLALGVRIDPADMEQYDKHWVREDPWGTSAQWSKLGPGSVVVGEQLISKPEVRKTAYYNDFGRRIGLTQCLAGLIDKHDGRLGFLAIDRGDADPSFGTEETALVTALMPHLQRALQVHRQIAAAESLTDGTLHALDSLAEAVFVVDASARVIRLNRSAESLLRGSNLVTLRQGELSFSTPVATARLRTLIAAAVATSCRSGTASGGRFQLADPRGGVGLRVLVSPASVIQEFFGGTARALVLVSDRERRAPSGAVLSSRYGLTEAEARLAVCVAQGRTLRQAAVELTLQESTVRTRLKTIFQKTDTHRQVDLVLLLRQLTDER